MKKRILSILLALCMCLTFVPVTVLADDLPQQESGISVFRISPDTGTYYTYKFYNGETLLSEQIVKNGDTLYEPPVTAPAGKTFTGWNPKVTFGTVSNVDKTEDIRVDAQFEDGYHVYFKDNNGRIIATKTVANGTEVTFEDVNFPVGSDEAITGWYEDTGRTKKVDSVTINGADITLYAKVEQGYWLTFESNGGSYVAPAFYAKDTAAKAPTAPTKLGYAFDGWYTDEGLTAAADFGSITGSVTLYAKWTASRQTKYTVIHFWENANDDEYSFKESETKTGATGDKTNATAKSYPGFTAQTITQQDIKGDGSTIVSVYYKRNVFKVTFYLDDPIYNCGKEEHTHWWPGCYDWRGKLDCGKEAHTHSSACGKIETIVIEAKHGANISDQWPTVNGSSTWRTSKNGNTYQANIDTMPLGGTNFYGPKTGNRYETAYYYVEVLPGEAGTDHGGVDYKLHHKDTSPGQGYSVTKEDKYAITGFTYKDGTRDGGNYDGAKFYYTRNSYNILFMNNGVRDKTVAKKFEQSIADASYTPTAPAGMTDYVFDGWYTNEQCEGDAFVFTGKTMPANNITLYAKWLAPTYTVTVYDQNGKKIDEITVSKGDTVTDWLSTQKNEITLDTGDSFLGWTINRGLPFNPGTKITTNYELYAKVGNSTGYSVTYNANGGTGSVTDTEKYAKGAEATVKSNSFTNDGKVFLSWNTQANGTGTTYYPNSTVKITGDVTLYAIWGDKASTVTVTYHSNFGTDQECTTEAMPNNKQIKVADYSALGLPTHTGYSFAGWNTEADGTGTAFAAGASARVDNISSNDLYAQWTPNTDTKYTVEFYYQNADGSYALNHTDNRKGTTDTTVYVTEEDKAAKEDGKYVYDTAVANVESGAVAADGTLVLKLYFKLNQADVTVNYYWNETTNKVATSKTLSAQTVGSVITTETPITIEGYTALPNQTSSLTVGADASKNVINFYYYKNVELTANSDTKVYTGAAQTITGYTASISGVTFNDISASGTGTDVGEYSVTFETNPKNMVDTTYKYIVTEATDGKLEIKQRDVTITGESASKTYNGKVQEITGITVEGLVDGHRLTGLTYSAKGKDAGKYDGSFTGQTVITDTDGKVVTDNYNVKTVAGVLTITRSYRPSTPSTPSTPVTSVKTGDMGIALYAMTSLLSLSGAVAIIKKRKEDEK